MRRTRFWCTGGLAAALMLASQSGVADETGETVETGPLETALITNELIVYGQKTERPLQDVDTSVGLLTGLQIEQDAAVDLYDVLDRIANVNSSLGEQGFTIRGISQRGLGGSSGLTLSVYVDGAVLGNQTTFFGPLDVWDLQQVEVFRGPQSTTQGRNALAGAIYIRSRDPSYEPDLKLRAGYGNVDSWQIAAAGGGTVVEDKVAFRLAFNKAESNGFITNTFLDQSADATDLFTGRGKLLIEPSDQVRALLTVSYTNNSAGEDLVPFPQGLREREVAYDFPGKEGTKTWIASGDLTWEATDYLTLRSITAYQTSDYVRIEDFDVAAASGASLDRTGKDESLTQEVQAQFDLDWVRGVFGLYYADTKFPLTDTTFIPVTFINPTLPFNNLIRRFGASEDKIKNYAVFGEAEFDLTDQLILIGGFRYDSEKQNNFAFSDTLLLGALPPGFGFLRDLIDGVTEEFRRTKYDAFLPKFGVRYEWTDTLSTAFTVQRAYRAGGSEINLVTSGLNEFDPEFLWNYEFSIRSAWLDGKLVWNFNIFYSDWTDQQVSIPISDLAPELRITVNAGKSELYGFESELNWQVSDQVSTFASIGFVHTEFKDFPFPTGQDPNNNLAGNKFPHAPKWSISVGADWTHPSGFFMSGNISYQSKSFSDQENALINELETRVLVDARAGYEWEGYKITVYANNLFNERYYTNLSRDTRNPSTGVGRIGNPRTYGVRVDATF